ncbi:MULTISPECIES: hypothetical protein [unclassified Nocardioides]|uniref:hypothetical protein n=1 Tax=unclassified Nocardioides TaxID=2615069 RepID=UPI0009F0FA4A|nr:MULTISPECIES: hypothetical protein [unclassified Nocardioides]GAW51682.1 hypothetical protein PD653B2_4027 [Nocardioides sp. PD653-B2]GAW55350.1 hypothetical protein PD653_2775 [Nocardioides sp. PD653]
MNTSSDTRATGALSRTARGRSGLRALAALVLVPVAVAVGWLVPQALTSEGATTWLQWSVAVGVVVEVLVVLANLAPRARDGLARAATYVGAALLVSLALGAVLFVVDDVPALDVVYLAALTAVPPAFAMVLAVMTRRDPG